jgi:hypothetical protein
MTINKVESLWTKTIKFFKISLQRYRKFSDKFNPIFLQTVQLTFVYFFAFIDLVYSVLSNIFALGDMPEVIKPFFPIIQAVLQSPFFRIWASPEKIFFLSYVVIEFMIIRKTFRFSKLVRYDILLIFSILMIQGIMISYWDALFNRQISSVIADWAFDDGIIIGLDKNLASIFFFLTFVGFFFIYIYLYIKALRGYFFTHPGFYWLTDSVSFWLKIKTSTMRFGRRKK